MRQRGLYENVYSDEDDMDQTVHHDGRLQCQITFRRKGVNTSRSIESSNIE